MLPYPPACAYIPVTAVRQTLLNQKNAGTEETKDMNTNMKELNMNEMEQASGGSVFVGACIFAGLVTLGVTVYATVSGYQYTQEKKKSGSQKDGATGTW